MDDSQLQTYYFEACVLYIATHGGLGTPPRSPFQLFKLETTDGTVSITSWTHESKQPDNTALKVFTVAQCLGLQRKQKIRQIMALNQSLKLTTTERDSMGIAMDEGTIIYNS